MGPETSEMVEGKDKKDSALPSPAGDGERSPLPRYTTDTGENSPRTLYDSVGMGQPPTTRPHPVRTGSAFYAETPAALELPNQFDESFAESEQNGHGGEEARAGLLRQSSRERISRGGVVGLPRKRAGPLAWWYQWLEQLSKLFVPQWRRTVLLMWIIWASMSFSEFYTLIVVTVY